MCCCGCLSPNLPNFPYMFSRSCIGCTYVYKGYILLLEHSLKHYVVISFFPCMATVLKSILSNISIATQLFYVHLLEIFFFYSFTFNLWRTFDLKCVFCRQHICGSCSLIYSATLCFLKNICLFIYLLTYLLIYLFLEGKGREKEKERNTNVWLPRARPLLGT